MSAIWEVATLDAVDPRLDRVVELWKPERKRLGLFPKGAFEDYARKGGIHVALDGDGLVKGYLATRVSGGWMHVAHLCVAPEARRSSAALQMVLHVVQIMNRCQHLGVRLKCRKDYDATSFWPKAGFHAGSSGEGKAKDSRLILWILRNPLVGDLFAPAQDEEARRKVVLDANVFFDLNYENEIPESVPMHVQESLYLSADWVSGIVELGIVDELLTEIHRRSCPEESKLQLARANGFPIWPYDQSEVNRHVKMLEKILGWGGPSREQRRSDIRQIAKAASSSAEFFVTRDGDLLAASLEISKAMSIRVVNPAMLLSTLDEEERGHLYTPVKILGTAIKEFVPKQSCLEEHCEKFLGRSPQEPLHHFKQRAKIMMASCSGQDSHTLKLVSDEHGYPILLRCFHFEEEHSLQIMMLRTAPHPLAYTVARHYLLEALQIAAVKGRREVAVSESYLSPAAESALGDLGFYQADGRWMKQLCAKILSTSEADSWPEHVPRSDLSDTGAMSRLEQSHWPLKIRDAGIESVSLTIKGHWAAKLFESNLAGLELFPVDPTRVLNRENVFYRSAKAWPRTLPSRILWYVSDTKSYRACSWIIEVKTGPASAIFRQYERLGIYQWKDVMEITGNDKHGQIMAIHFADTELFDSPVALSDVRKFNGGRILVGAHAISEQEFFRIYEAGLTRLQ